MATWQRFKAIGRAVTAAAFTAATLAGCMAPLRVAHVPSPDAKGFLASIAGLSNSAIARGRTTGFWYNPDHIYAARLDAVRKAKKSILFETYYMTGGRRADEWADALIARAKAGVKVSFLADDQGTIFVPSAYWKRLRQAGIELRFYHPMEASHPWTYDLRTHRKLLIIDGKSCFTGGAGVSDEWDGAPMGGGGGGGGGNAPGPWCEMEVRLEGPVVTTLEGVFFQHWTNVGGAADLDEEAVELPLENTRRLLVTASSPADGGSPMRALYHTLLCSARKRIWIASPYFLPSREDQAALIRARRAGVDVRVLAVGPVNDQASTYQAARDAAMPMVKAGVPIMEYQGAMMHAKSILIDDRWVVVGSANFDPRSLFQNEELTVLSDEPGLARETHAFFEQSFQHTRRLTLDDLRCRDPWTCVQARALLMIWYFL